MFMKTLRALFNRPAHQKWDAPHHYHMRQEHHRLEDQEAAFRAHLMRHTHYR